MDDFDFLKVFPKDESELYIVYDRFTFLQLFKLLLKEGLEHEEALFFILANCSLSAIVFQDYFHNEAYLEITTENVLESKEAARRAIMISDFMDIIVAARSNK